MEFTKDREYRPVLMWFWNHKIEKDEVKKQIDSMCENGIYEFFIHPMSGLETEFLSDEFMELIAFAVKTAKENGMKFWIYDEYNWPSGQAGGTIVADGAPEDLAKGVFKTVAVKNGDNFEAAAPGTLLFAEALYHGRYSDVTADVKKSGDGYSVVCKAESVIFYTTDFFKTQLSSSAFALHNPCKGGLADLFRKETADKYFERVYGKYEKYIGEEYGKTVIGSFTDEDYASSPFEVGEGKIPFTPEVIEKFESETGLNFNECLKYFYSMPESGLGRAAKSAYFAILARMYLENFLTPLSEYCKSKNLILTGHLQGSGHLTWEITTVGNFFYGMSMFGYPGCDIVCPQYSVDNKDGIRFLSGITAILRTVSKYFGCKRVLSETYSGADWDYTMEDILRTAHHLLVYGVNMIQYMGGYYSLDGTRKKYPIGYPPSHNSNNPYFDFYREMGDKLRLPQKLSSETFYKAHVAMFIPKSEAVNTIDMENLALLDDKNFSGYDNPLSHCEKLYHNISEAFLRIGVGCDVIDEFESKLATAGNGKMMLRGFEYDTVILPAMETVRPQVETLVKTLDANGVRVIFVNVIPLYLTNGEFASLSYEFEEYGGSENAVFCKCGNDYLIKTDGIPTAEKLKTVLSDFGFESEYGFKAEGKSYLSVRESETKEIAFLFNSENREIAVSFGALPENAVFVDYDGFEVGIPSKLMPYEFLIIDINKDGTRAKYEKAPSFAEKGSKDIDFRLEKPTNAYRPECYTVKVNDESRVIGICDRIDFVENGGGYSVSFDFENDFGGRVFLCGEYEDIIQLRLNDSLVKLEKTRLWGSFDFETDVTDLLKKGKNTVEAVCIKPSWECWHTAPFIFLKGDFYADKNGISGKELSKEASHESGLPYFFGRLEYKAEFEAKGNAVLEFETESPLKIVLNGKSFDLVARPFKKDVSALLKDGKNELTVYACENYRQLFVESHPTGLKKITLIY